MSSSDRTARVVADELLAALVAERRAEALKLALVCELADCYRSVTPALSVPGGPRLVSAGPDGTVDVDGVVAIIAAQFTGAMGAWS